MKRAYFRFYAELNDFLPLARRGVAFPHEFHGGLPTERSVPRTTVRRADGGLQSSDAPPSLPSRVIEVRGVERQGVVSSRERDFAAAQPVHDPDGWPNAPRPAGGVIIRGRARTPVRRGAR